MRVGAGLHGHPRREERPNQQRGSSMIGETEFAREGNEAERNANKHQHDNEVNDLRMELSEVGHGSEMVTGDS
jgi:hypothetical protein